jgi:IclR helix-turn-helix domain
MPPKRKRKLAEPSISIALSPRQVEEVIRAVQPGRAPGFASIMAALRRAGGAGMPGDPDHRLSRSLLRGLAILACFGTEDEALGVMEIAARLGLNPSTVHRYLLTLVEARLLEQAQETREYHLPRA